VGQRQQQGSDSGDVQPPFVIRLAELNNSAVLLRGGGFEEEEQEEEEEEEEEQQQQPARDWAATSGCIWGRFGPADWFC
jgi:hypothetical protein